MLTHSLSRAIVSVATYDPVRTGAVMSFIFRVLPVAAFAAVVLLAPALASAQSSDAKPAEKPAQPGDAAKESQRKIDEFAEAGAKVSGPAGNPECVWLGRRVVGLLWRDDLDTAFRHLDLYDRFGCPGQHIQATFRCVVRKGNIDPKAPESLSARVHACWLEPVAPTQPPTSAATPASPGTTTK